MTGTSIWLKVRALFLRRQVERELREELDFHAEMQIRKNLQLGLTKDEARRRAPVKFGSGGKIEEECQDSHREAG